MATNIGDELVGVLRTRLQTAPSLPSTRMWQNQRGEPAATASWVDDEIVTWDTEDREVGPSAWKRSEVLYKVGLRVPTGTDVHTAMAMAFGIRDTFTASPLTVSGQSVWATNGRTGPTLPDRQWLFVPIYLSLNFDHA